MKTLGLVAALVALLMTVAGCGDDTTAPTIEAFYPHPAVDGNVTPTAIQVNGIKVLFDEAIAETTVDTNSFAAKATAAFGRGVVSGVVSYDSNTRSATFMPDSALKASWAYVVTISTAVTDVAGNNLAVEQLTTITIADPAPATDGTTDLGVDASGWPNPSPDSDGDGYADSVDDCPYQGDAGYGVDANGCPNPGALSTSTAG